MTLIAIASDLIVVFLALEILSLSLYVLTGFSPAHRVRSRRAMKYFLLGAFSSAFFLFGIAMAYGATGTTGCRDRAGARRADRGPGARARGDGAPRGGFAFKVSAVPFHMWTPDVYQGAPTAVTAFMSAGRRSPRSPR